MKFASNQINILTTATGEPSVAINGSSVFVLLAVLGVHCHWLHSCIMSCKGNSSPKVTLLKHGKGFGYILRDGAWSKLSLSMLLWFGSCNHYI
jgi:hypothetical protein